MSLPRTTIFIHIVSAYCILASLGDECVKLNRFPPPHLSHLLQFYCGRCLPGYLEDGNDNCIQIACPPDSSCDQQHRRPCDVSTRGQCGRCRNDYLEVEGICVTEPEIESLIKRIETILSPSDAKPQNEEKLVEDEDGSESRVDPNIDQKGESEITLDGDVVPAIEGDSEQIEERNATHLAAAKRPAGTSSGAKQQINQTDKKVAGVNQLVFFGLVLAVSLICVVAIVVASVCGFRLHKRRKLAETSEYQGYGGRDDKSSVPRSESGDRRLAHSAQMYHYQHHKQNMLSLHKSTSDKLDDSETDEEHDISGNEGADDDRVYECPGLAETGEMEVQNPLFLVKGTSTTPTPTASPTEQVRSPGSSGSSALVSPVISGKQLSATSSD